MEKRKRGQPRKAFVLRNLSERIYFLEAKGFTNEDTCKALDISLQALIDHKKSPEYADALKDSKKYIDDKVQGALLRRALGYEYQEEVATKEGPQMITRVMQPDVTACIFWLKNRRPLEWREKREVEHSGEVSIVQLARIAAAARGVNQNAIAHAN